MIIKTNYDRECEIMDYITSELKNYTIISLVYPVGSLRPHNTFIMNIQVAIMVGLKDY